MKGVNLRLRRRDSLEILSPPPKLRVSILFQEENDKAHVCKFAKSSRKPVDSRSVYYEKIFYSNFRFM